MEEQENEWTVTISGCMRITLSGLAESKSHINIAFWLDSDGIFVCLF